VSAYYFLCRLQKVCQQAFSIYFWSISGFFFGSLFYLSPCLSLDVFIFIFRGRFYLDSEVRVTNHQGNSTRAGRTFAAQHHLSFVSDPAVGALLLGFWMGTILYKDSLV